MIEIRLLQNGEEDDFLSIKSESFQNASRFLIENPDHKITSDSIKQQINATPAKSAIYVLVYNKKIFGFAQATFGIYQYRKHTAMIHSVYVSKDLYKEYNMLPKVTFGTQLLVEFISYLRNQGIEVVTLMSFEDNVKMNSICHTLGITQTSIDKMFLKFDENLYRGVCFWYLETLKLKIPNEFNSHG